jgi:hypothetical protein
MQHSGFDVGRVTLVNQGGIIKVKIKSAYFFYRKEYFFQFFAYLFIIATNGGPNVALTLLSKK